MSDELVKVEFKMPDAFKSQQKSLYDFEKYLIDMMPKYNQMDNPAGDARSVGVKELMDSSLVTFSVGDDEERFLITHQGYSELKVAEISGKLNSGIDLVKNVQAFYLDGSAAEAVLLTNGVKKSLKIQPQLKTAAFENVLNSVVLEDLHVFVKAYKNGYVIFVKDDSLNSFDNKKLKELAESLIAISGRAIYKVFVNNKLIIDNKEWNGELLRNAGNDNTMDLTV